ncbi:hypothetical protein EV175_002872, partial [Coemansia sp. RSA 1933]
MDTDFEKLMRLAEKTTLDIQRSAVERKRIAGSKGGGNGSATVTGTREEQEKHRRLELERRVRQRDEDERKRQMRAKESLERRRRERAQADKVQKTQLHQQQQQSQQSQQAQQAQQMQKQSKRTAQAHKVPEQGRATQTQPQTAPLSYSELMRIASGQPATPPEPKRTIRTDAPPNKRPLSATSTLPAKPKTQAS